MAWAEVKTAVETAHGIHYEGCHKIYVSMDETEFKNFRNLGYGSDDGSFSIAIVQTEAGRAEAYDKLIEWFEDSCGLRFINSVRTVVPPEQDDGFTRLIGQFELDDEENEENNDA